MIDIIVTCYNSSKFIEEAIKSIYDQNYKDWNLIIIDDFSKDNSIEVIHKVIKKLKIKNVKLIKHDKNFGYGKSLKDGIDNGNSELIAIVDSDDSLNGNDALDLMVRKHIENPNASLIYSKYYECDRNLKPIKLSPSRQLKGNESYINTKIRISHLKVFKRSFYNKTSGVNKNLLKCIDKDLILKLEESSGEFIFINKPLYLYRKHKNNLTHSLDKKICKKMRKMVYTNAKKRRGLK